MRDYNTLIEACCWSSNNFIKLSIWTKEILMNGKLGDLFNPGDQKSLCKKICNYYKNKKVLNKKSMLAKKYLYRFDYQKNLEKYLVILKKLINK